MKIHFNPSYILKKLQEQYGSFILFIVLILSMLGAILSSPTILFIATLLIFTNNLAFALRKIKNHIVFFIFHGTFFVFLLGRFVSNGIFGYSAYWYEGIFDLSFDLETVNFILLTIIVSLATLFVSYYRTEVIKNRHDYKFYDPYRLLSSRIDFFQPLSFLNLKIKHRLRMFIRYVFTKTKALEYKIIKLVLKLFRKDEKNADYLTDKSNLRISLQKSALIIFYVTIIFHFIYVISEIVYTRKVGYHGSYLNVNPLYGSPLFIIGEMYDIALFTFLSLIPKKRDCYVPIALYIFDGMFFLVSGRRLEFMLNLLIIITYILIRHYYYKERWFNKKLIIAAIIVSPILIITLATISDLRIGKTMSLDNMFNPLLKFFYDQGVSSRVIGHAYVHYDELPRFRFYSLGTIIEFIKYKLIGNYILGNPVPLGQNIDRAIHGHLFSQAIAYLAIPDQYLKGVGTGSSYIAELFVDFKWFGIVVGNYIYGKFISKFMDWAQSRKIVVKLFAYLMIRGFYLTPRSGYSSFLTTAFSPRQLMGFLLILLLAYGLNLMNNMSSHKLTKVYR